MQVANVSNTIIQISDIKSLSQVMITYPRSFHLYAEGFIIQLIDYLLDQRTAKFKSKRILNIRYYQSRELFITILITSHYKKHQTCIVSNYVNWRYSNQLSCEMNPFQNARTTNNYVRRNNCKSILTRPEPLSQRAQLLH